MYPGDNQVLRGSKRFGQSTALQYSATASAVPLKYDIIIW